LIAALFEDENYGNFPPLTYTRPTAQERRIVKNQPEP